MNTTPDPAHRVFAPGPAALYKHDHLPVVNPMEKKAQSVTFGQRIADKVTIVVGSWVFIITQSCLLAIWIAINFYLVFHPQHLKAWDPYPFILLNLVLSFQAAYTGPIVMMSQNRQGEKDRAVVDNDFHCNVTAEEEIRVLMEHLVHQDAIMLAILARLERIEYKEAESEGFLPPQ